MTQPVSDARQQARGSVQNPQGETEYVKIGARVPASDMIGCTLPSPFERAHQGTTVIRDVNPVTDLQAIPIHGNGSSVDCVRNRQGKQFFGELVKPIIVAGTGDESVVAEGVGRRAHEMLGSSLARGVGTAGRER